MNVNDMAKAILEAKRNVANAAGDSNSFLNRISQHAELLNETAVPPVETIHTGLFSSSPSAESLRQQREESPPQQSNVNVIDHHGLVCELPVQLLRQLNAIFGDGADPNEWDQPVRVELPLWIGELLHRAAAKNVPIPETQEAYRTELASGEGKRAPQKVFSNQAKGVELLLSMFPNVNPKVIRSCYKENDFDEQRTADYLMEVEEQTQLTELESGCVSAGAVQTRITPSHHPRVITEEEQRINWANDAEKEAPVPYGWYDINAMDDQLRRLNEAYSHNSQMKTAHVGLKNGAVNGHYSRTAQDCKVQLAQLKCAMDRLHILHHSKNEQLDLHEMCCERAIEAVKFKIDVCRMKHINMKRLIVVTGYGKTTGKMGQIKPRLKAYLEKQGIRYVLDKDNPGVVVVSLSGLHGRLTQWPIDN